MAYVLFISESKLKSLSAINLNCDPDLLRPYILQSQKLYIETKLGTDLTQKIKDLITANTISDAGNAVYKTLLDDYISFVLVHYSFWHSIPFLRFKIENGNIYSKTSETGTALSTEEAQHLREEVVNTAQYYAERLVTYLRNNTGSYPEFSTNTGADVNPETGTAYYNGMNLERPSGQGTKLTLRDFIPAGNQ